MQVGHEHARHPCNPMGAGLHGDSIPADPLPIPASAKPVDFGPDPVDLDRSFARLALGGAWSVGLPFNVSQSAALHLGAASRSKPATAGMSGSLLLASLWLVLANVIAMFPSKRKHWPAAYVLMPLGAGIVGFVIYQHGLLIGALVLAAGGSILRWPVIYFARWLGRLAGVKQRR